MKKFLAMVMFSVFLVSVLPADVFGFEMGMTKEEVEKQCEKGFHLTISRGFIDLAASILVGTFISPWLFYTGIVSSVVYDRFDDNIEIGDAEKRKIEKIQGDTYEVKPEKKSALFSDYTISVDNYYGLYLIVTQTKSYKQGSLKQEFKKLCNTLSKKYGKYSIYDVPAKSSLENGKLYAVFQTQLIDNLNSVVVDTIFYYDEGIFGFGSGEKVKFVTTFVFNNANMVLKYKE